MTRLVAVVAALVLVSAGVMWWFIGRGEDYCGLVNEKTQAVQSGQGAMQNLVEGLPELRELAGAAPSDLKDEWQVVLAAVVGMERAFVETGVDPATSSIDDLPPTVTAEQRQRLQAAASKLISSETREAVDGIEQHARDVCHVPLQI